MLEFKACIEFENGGMCRTVTKNLTIKEEYALLHSLKLDAKSKVRCDGLETIVGLSGLSLDDPGKNCNNRIDDLDTIYTREGTLLEGKTL